MSTSFRTRRIVKWIGVVITALMIMAILLSFRWQLGYRLKGQHHAMIHLASGRLLLQFYEFSPANEKLLMRSAPPPGLYMSEARSSLKKIELVPSQISGQISAEIKTANGTAVVLGTGKGIFVPLWIPLIVLVATTTLLLWRDRKRARTGYCIQCGYNLFGNTSGRCPECGILDGVAAVAGPEGDEIGGDRLTQDSHK